MRYTPLGLASFLGLLTLAGTSLPARITGFLPDGIAVARDGTVYTDIFLGNGWASASAIVALGPNRKPRLLWTG